MSTSQASTTWLKRRLLARLTALEAQVLARPAEVYAVVQLLLTDLRAVQKLSGASWEEDAPNEVMALHLLAWCAFLTGDDTAAAQHAEAGCRVSREAGLSPLEAGCLEVLGLVRGRRGDLEHAARLLRQSLHLLLGAGDDAGRGRLFRRVGGAFEGLGESSQALTLYRESLELLPPGSPEVAAVQAGMGRALYNLGQHQKSQQITAQALAHCRALNLTRLEGQVQMQQALNLLELGQPAATYEYAGQAYALARATDDRVVQCEAAWLQGASALVLGRLDRAKRALSWGERLARQLKRPDLLARVRESQSRLHEQLGEPVQALSCLREQQKLDRAHRIQLAGQRARLPEEHLQLFGVLGAARSQPQGQEQPQQAPGIQSAGVQSPSIQSPGVQSVGPPQVASPQQVVGPKHRVACQREPAYQTLADQLTGLVNRSFFWTRVRQALEDLGPGQSLGLIVIDIDHLRAINDRFGHTVGDQVIAELARRLRDSVRPNDLVGRLSGDGFMVLLHELIEPSHLRQVAEGLLKRLRQPVTCGTEQVSPTVSLGCVVAPQNGNDTELLRKYADLALLQAKGEGRNRVVVFAGDPSVQEQELRYAVRHGQLRVHYQGLFRLPGQEPSGSELSDFELSGSEPSSAQLSGFEALVRWQHPERGMVSPSCFIALAEESRLILELGYWVLDEACRQARAWGLPERGLTMAVNVSALQFEQLDFVEGVHSCLQRHGLPGSSLVLELTESMVHRDPSLAHQTLRDLQALEVQVAMDDFGTGYSSLSTLKNLPFGVLKIDREFLRDLTCTSGQFAASRQFIEVIVGLARTLNMRVVAEGVETAEQYDLLCALGCDEAQGYWLARPLPPTEAAALLLGEPPVDRLAVQDPQAP